MKILTAVRNLVLSPLVLVAVTLLLVLAVRSPSGAQDGPYESAFVGDCHKMALNFTVQEEYGDQLYHAHQFEHAAAVLWDAAMFRRGCYRSLPPSPQKDTSLIYEALDLYTTYVVTMYIDHRLVGPSVYTRGYRDLLASNKAARILLSRKHLSVYVVRMAQELYKNTQAQINVVHASRVAPDPNLP